MVHALLVVPPMATRYYLADLAPGRSIVEHLVRGGQQVFVLSWRNPGPEHAVWDLDTYGRAVLDAMDACEHITRTSGTSRAETKPLIGPGLRSGMGLSSSCVCASMAARSGLSKSTIGRAWKAFGLKPHLVDTFKLSNDPLFEEKLVDVVGLYLDPPDNAVVLCMDEKSSVQAYLG